MIIVYLIADIVSLLLNTQSPYLVKYSYFNVES